MKTESYLDYVDQLNPSYRDDFDQVVRYSNLLEGMSINRKNEKLEDLLEIMLSAQEAGRPVEKVCGRDVQIFCREFFGEYDIRYDLYELLNKSRGYVWLLAIESLFYMVLWFLDPEFSQDGSLFWHPVDEFCAEYILVITVGSLLLIISEIIERHMMFWSKKFSKKRVIFFQGILIIFYIAAIILVIMDNGNLISLPFGIQLTGSVIWLAALYVLKSKLKGDVDKAGLETLIKSLKDEIPAEIDEHFPAAMEKKYRTVRDKKQKKGSSYSMENYLRDEEATSIKMLKLKHFYFSLPVICSLLVLFVMYGSFAESGFTGDAVMQILCCVGITFAVECIVMFLLWRFIKKTALTRLAWIRQKREELEAGEPEREA